GDVLAARVGRLLRPGVYDVRWSALGADGHVVSGSYRFGVSPRGGGAPPGAERLGGAAGPGARGTASSGEGFFSVGLRWLALLGAALLLGGFVLRARLGGGDVDEARWRRASRIAVAVVVVACAE